MELRQSPEWGKYLASLSWRTEVIDGCVLRIKKLGPFGSIIKIQRSETLPLERIEEETKSNRPLFIKVEPSDETQVSELRTHNYQPDSWPLTPPRTIFIDLTKTEEKLLVRFSKDTRQTLKKLGLIGFDLFQRLNPLETVVFSFEGFDEIREKSLRSFYQIWRETGRRNHFFIQPYRELRSKVQAFGAKAVLIEFRAGASEIGPARPPRQHRDPGSGHDNHDPETSSRALAGCLLLFCDEVAYYHHAASSKEGQERGAPYAVMWQAISESKKRGLKKLDLEGIFDPRFKFMNSRSWHNFSTFKLKWGGEVFEYPGSFIKVYNPLVKLLFAFDRN